MSSSSIIIPKSIVSIVESSTSSSTNNQIIKLIIRAKPGAKKSQIVQIDDEAIGVQIAAPPKEGAANEELIDYMSHVLGVKSRCIQLDVGTKSRNKILLINFGNEKIKQQQQIMTAEKVFEILKQNLER